MALLSLLSGSGQSPSQRTGEIRDLEERWRSAQQRDDRTELDRLLAPDASFIGTSGTLRTKPDFLASRSTSMIPRASYRIDELAIRRYGSTVVVTGLEATDGEGRAFRGRFTHVWVRRGERWQLVAVQRTEIAGPS